MRTITAMFDSRADAENARQRLTAAGVSEDDIMIHDHDIFRDRSHSRFGKAKVDPDRESRGVSSGQPPEGASDGSAGTHRNVIGDFVDDRTGKAIGSDAGSDRNFWGDFLDADNRRRGDQDAVQSRDDDPETGLWDRIKSIFSDDDDVYAEGLRRGGHLLIAKVDERDTDQVVHILDQDGTVDLASRQSDWRRDGWSGRDQGRSADTGRGDRVRDYDWMT